MTKPLHILSKKFLVLLIIISFVAPYGIPALVHNANAQDPGSGLDAGGNQDLGGDDTADDDFFGDTLSSAGGTLSCLAYVLQFVDTLHHTLYRIQKSFQDAKRTASPIRYHRLGYTEHRSFHGFLFHTATIR